MPRRIRTIRVGALCLSGLFAAACAAQPPAGAELGLERQAVRGSADGDAVIDTAGAIVNRYATLGQDALRGARSLQLSSAMGLGIEALSPLAAGDVLLIVQPQGADLVEARDTADSGAVIDYGGAGAFELVTVKSVDDNNDRIEIYGNCGGLRNNYQKAGNPQVIRVPQYASLNVKSAASIVAPAWNGAVGGVVAILVRDGAQVDGLIDVSARGFRGGKHSAVSIVRSPGVGSFYASQNQLDGGAKGEGVGGFVAEYTQLGNYGRGAAGNGGGGGNRLLGGGGGGGNGGTLSAWNGQGVMQKSVVGGAAAWPLDPGYDSAQVSFAGGGRGGYTASSAALDPTAIAPGNPSWKQDFRRERGGLGGRPVPNDPQSRLFFGGGGGAGDDFQDQSGDGGRGGGLVFLVAAAVSGSGRIAGNGENGAPARATIAAGGGGGAGGTLFLGGGGITGVVLEARGGTGGGQTGTGAQAAGPGGGGGGGYVALPAGAQPGIHVEGGAGGTTASSDMVRFPRNGAADGALGQAEGVTSGELGTSQFCAGADLLVRLIPTPEAAAGREPLTVQVEVENQGPSPADAVELHLHVADGTTLSQKQPGDWDCALTGADLSCKRNRVQAGETSSVTVTLIPPFGAASLSMSAEVSAETQDLAGDNNRAAREIGNAAPSLLKATGGGLSCTMTARPASPFSETSGGIVLLWGMFLAAFVSRTLSSGPGARPTAIDQSGRARNEGRVV